MIYVYVFSMRYHYKWILFLCHFIYTPPLSPLWKRGEGAVFFVRIEAGAGLGGGSGHLAVALDDGVGELLLELDKEMD